MPGRHAAAEERAATYREIFGVAEFRFLFVAHLLSLIGDELARVALGILVYAETDSALLAAVTFGVSYAPWLLGGPVLAAFADRYPRRQVLVVTDLGRGLLIGAIAIPGLPIPAMLALLFLSSWFAPPFESARSALMPDVLEGDRYAVGTSVTNISSQVGQLLGFVGGGALVLLIDPRGALVVNAVTFLVSAALVQYGVRNRPAAKPEGAAESVWAETAAGLRLLAKRRSLLRIVGLLWVGQLFLTAPEGLANPYAEQLGYGPIAVGLFLAANPLGLVIGGVVIGRFCPPSLREQLTFPLAVFAMLPMILAGFVDSLAVVLALFVLSGFGASYIIPLNVSFVREVPPAFRGRAFGAAVSGLYAVQGLGTVLAGAAAEKYAPSTVVLWSGLLGLVGLLLLALLRHDRSGPSEAGPRHSPDSGPQAPTEDPPGG